MHYPPGKGVKELYGLIGERSVELQLVVWSSTKFKTAGRIKSQSR